MLRFSPLKLSLFGLIQQATNDVFGGFFLVVLLFSKVGLDMSCQLSPMEMPKPIFWGSVKSIFKRRMLKSLSSILNVKLSANHR